MKKVLILTTLIIFIMNIPAYAAFNHNPESIVTVVTYLPWKDEYRVDHGLPPYGTWDSMRVYFETVTGTPYSASYTPSQVSGKIYYLTCNGTYQFFFDSGGVELYWTKIIVTTQIQNPSCLSYPDGGAKNDLGASYNDNGDGTYSLDWQSHPNASNYEIWLNGQKIADVPAGSNLNQVINGTGAVNIVAKDPNGNTVGHSDLQVPEYNGQPDWARNGSCDVCQKLKDLLACPDWDAYMGELTGAIRNALPTLPEWRNIADQFVDAFDDYFGDPPAIPNPTHIAPEIPAIDTSYNEADISPAVPSEYNTPIEFDITTGEEIPVVDDSEPIEIYDPDEFIDADGHGVFVYPNDPRNTSNGIKNPDQIETGYDTPTPTMIEQGDDLPEIPPAEIPIPSESGGSTPQPDYIETDIALPTK